MRCGMLAAPPHSRLSGSGGNVPETADAVRARRLCVRHPAWPPGGARPSSRGAEPACAHHRLLVLDPRGHTPARLPGRLATRPGP